MDGGVGLYDMGAKKWDFLRDLVFWMYKLIEEHASGHVLLAYDFICKK